MKWSKSKKALENLLANSVKDHVQFHMTRYGPGVSSYKVRAWITWDKKELVNMSNVKWERELNALSHQIHEIHDLDYMKKLLRGEISISIEDSRDMHEAARRLVQKKGLLSRYQFEQAVEEYLELSIDKAIDSDNPIIKALSMFDRRLGKRRLVEISLSTEEHPLVKLLYHLRCEAEGLLKVKN